MPYYSEFYTVLSWFVIELLQLVIVYSEILVGFSILKYIFSISFGAWHITHKSI